MESLVGTALAGERVLVTGATGLVGSWLLDSLLQMGAEVIAIVRDRVPQSLAVSSGLLDRVIVAPGDITNARDIRRTLSEYRPSTIFHLGAQTQVTVAYADPQETFETNVRGTWQLLDAVRTLVPSGMRVMAIVVASSDKAYGEQDELPYTEAAPLHGTYPYDVSKSCTDLIAQSYAHAYGLPVVIARCGNIYGGGDLNPNRIVPSTIRSILNGRRPVIRSDGTYLRDYVYVKDIVRAYTRLAEAIVSDPSLRGEAFNFGLDQPVTVMELVRLILSIMGSDLEPIVENTATGEIRKQYLNSGKARGMLSWAPAYGLRQGLAETVEFHRREAPVS